jgi:mRNA-degrading endonuclease RelE of RelBE toxin-antitoxin system
VENSYIVNPLKVFFKDIKRLQKKYRYILDDVELLEKELRHNPTMGTPLKGGLYKIRIKNSDKKQGKSGGYRVITYYIDNTNSVNLFRIYDKSEFETISTEELLKAIKEILGE